MLTFAASLLAPESLNCLVISTYRIQSALKEAHVN